MDFILEVSGPTTYLAVEQETIEKNAIAMKINLRIQSRRTHLFKLFLYKKKGRLTDANRLNYADFGFVSFLQIYGLFLEKQS